MRSPVLISLMELGRVSCYWSGKDQLTARYMPPSVTIPTPANVDHMKVSSDFAALNCDLDFNGVDCECDLRIAVFLDPNSIILARLNA